MAARTLVEVVAVEKSRTGRYLWRSVAIGEEARTEGKKGRNEGSN